MFGRLRLLRELAAKHGSVMHEVYLAKGALATTAIEGNTLTEQEARAAIDGALRLPPSKEYLEIEIMNMIDAFNEVMQEGASDSNVPLTAARIAEMNRQVLKGLEPEPGVVPGEVSTHGVVVGGYRGPRGATATSFCAGCATGWRAT